jgi:hypothetical protein
MAVTNILFCCGMPRLGNILQETLFSLGFSFSGLLPPFLGSAVFLG